MSGSRPVRPEEIRIQGGFSLLEVLVVAALIAILAAIVTPLAGKLIRRSEGMAALSTVRQVLAVARLEAVKTSAEVVVVVSKDPNNEVRLRTFRDKADLTTANPNDGNGVQDAGEPTVGDVALSTRIHFWKQQDSGSVDRPDLAVLFDSCVGDASSRCIVFIPGGGISPPASGLATPTGGRGIYFADWQGKNYFRVTVESDLSGKARVDKYVNEAAGYYAPNSDQVKKWRWL